MPTRMLPGRFFQSHTKMQPPMGGAPPGAVPKALPLEKMAASLRRYSVADDVTEIAFATFLPESRTKWMVT